MKCLKTRLDGSYTCGLRMMKLRACYAGMTKALGLFVQENLWI